MSAQVATSEPFDRDRYFEVTLRSWDRNDTFEVHDPLTRDAAQIANTGAFAATGWPVHMRPAEIAGLQATVKPNRASWAARLRWWAIRS